MIPKSVALHCRKTQSNTKPFANRKRFGIEEESGLLKQIQDLAQRGRRRRRRKEEEEVEAD